MSILALLILVLIALILLGGVAGIVVLLIHPNGRVIGMVGLLCLLMLLMGTGILGTASHAYRRSESLRGSHLSAIEPCATVVAAEASTSGTNTPLLITESSESDADSLPAEALPETDASRPAWVEAEPQRVGDVYQMSIVVGPYTTLEECHEHMGEAVQKAVGQYAVEYLKEPRAAGRIPWPLPTIPEEDRWEETRRYSVGPMKNLHVLLKFDRKFNGEVEEAWRKAQIEERIGGVAGMGVLVLGSLAVLFGLLKFTARKRA